MGQLKKTVYQFINSCWRQLWLILSRMKVVFYFNHDILMKKALLRTRKLGEKCIVNPKSLKNYDFIFLIMCAINSFHLLIFQCTKQPFYAIFPDFFAHFDKRKKVARDIICIKQGEILTAGYIIVVQ